MGHGVCIALLCMQRSLLSSAQEVLHAGGACRGQYEGLYMPAPAASCPAPYLCLKAGLRFWTNAAMPCSRSGVGQAALRQC